MGPTRTPLPGGRWHFAHGPIELVIGAQVGRVQAVGDVNAAHDQAWARFQTVLQELVAELPLLRQPVQPGPCPVQGPVARRMWRACAALPTDFITPMAAVAGAVAQEILAPFAQAGLQRAYVNNGGDIALHLAPGAQWRVGVVADIAKRRTALDGGFTVHASDPVRGVATSSSDGLSPSLNVALSRAGVKASAPVSGGSAGTVMKSAVWPT